jgi:DNA mismatch repair protein MutS
MAVRLSDNPMPQNVPLDDSSGSFHSILFQRPEEREAEPTEEPQFFRDLNLDQVVEAITAGREKHNLKPFYYTPLKSGTAIAYRHEVMRDLEHDQLFQAVSSFSDAMRAMRERLTASEKLYYKDETLYWRREAIEMYCKAVEALLHDLYRCNPNSTGLLAFRNYLLYYANSNHFKTLFAGAQKLKSDLSAIRYCVLINDSRVTVQEYKSEIDYTAVIEETFSKFRRGAAKDYRVNFQSLAGLNHVEAMILERVAQLHPDLFHALDDYCNTNRNYLDKTVVDFDREVQFYLAYLEYLAKYKRSELHFCYPRLSRTSKVVRNRAGFDLALARKLIDEGSNIICNDWVLDRNERILVVTGPNQGGKTTFARAFGQLHYLASLGCPVPGSEAELFLFDRLFTHFEREEDLSNLRGKLQDDLMRIHEILEQATSSSIIIINEIFSATTVQDALLLSRKILERISQRDLLCICVTFLDELSCLNEKIASCVAGVAPDDPTVRTYKIEKRAADGRAYALAIADKYRLTYDRLRQRMKS